MNNILYNKVIMIEFLTEFTQILFIVCTVTIGWLIGAWVSLGNFDLKDFYNKYWKNDNTE